MRPQFRIDEHISRRERQTTCIPMANAVVHVCRAVSSNRYENCTYWKKAKKAKRSEEKKKEKNECMQFEWAPYVISFLLLSHSCYFTYIKCSTRDTSERRPATKMKKTHGERRRKRRNTLKDEKPKTTRSSDEHERKNWIQKKRT